MQSAQPVSRIKTLIPNGLTVFRLLTAGLLLVLCAVPASSSLLMAQVFAILGIASDKLDGTLARAWGAESDLGKRLESFADPLFGLAVGFYIYIQLDLPTVFVVAALVYIGIGTLGRILIALFTRELFYEKSQITRFGVGVTFVLLLMFLFQLPFREYVMWFMVVYGGIMCANYVRMEIQFIQQHRKTPPQK